jgi:hypothetical protein
MRTLKEFKNFLKATSTKKLRSKTESSRKKHKKNDYLLNP